MSSRIEREAEDLYEQQNDASPVPGDVLDDSYARETRRELNDTVPMQRDQQYIEDPMQPPYSNSNDQLAEDEREAINKSNILRGGRLRHEKPQTQNKYNEGPGENDLPKDVQYGNMGFSGTKRLS